MKKFVFLLLVFLTLNTALFSQEIPAAESSSTESDVIDFQGEVLRWEAVPRAKKYQVVIEKLQDDGSWKKTKSYTTTNNYYNANLDPGEYRVSISTFNVLGKKSSTSEWVEFLVLGNQTPYIYFEYFNKVSKYNAPVLYIDKNNKDITKLADYKSYLIPANGQPENSFTLKGRNVFYSSTKFMLVPVEKSKNGGNEYPLAVKNRESVELKVLNKNSRTYKLNLQYDKEKLSSGYYNLTAINPDGSKYEVSILVITDEKIKIEPVDFKIDERYQIRRLDIDKTGQVNISFVAHGITDETKYYLRQIQNTVGYPFDSKLNVEQVYGNLVSAKPRSDSGFDVVVTFNVEKLRTSYYNFYAQKDFTQMDSFEVLIVRPFLSDSEHKEKVEKIKTKLKKRSTDVIFTVDGKKLEDASAVSLVSEYKREIDGNSKLKVDLQKESKSGKYKAVINYNKLHIGDYGLQIDTPDGEFVYTFEMNNYLKSKETKLSKEEFTDTFFKPLPSLVQNSDGEAEDNLKIKDLDSLYKTVKHVPIFIPYTYIHFSYIPMLSEIVDEYGRGIMPFDFSGEVDLLNFGFFSITPGIKFNPNMYVDYVYSDLSLYVSTKFIVPGKYFSPYVGAEAGIYLFDFGTMNPWVTLDFADFKNRNDYYFGGKLGIVLFSFIDFRYNLEWHKALSDEKQFFKDSVSIGIRLPINPPYYSTDFINRNVEISGKKVVTVKDFDTDVSNIGTLIFTDRVEEVSDFKNLKSVHTVKFRGDITKLGPECFANCKLLTNVHFEYTPKLTQICKNAFKNDTEIDYFEIPATVTTIEEGAFAGWTNDQEIRLLWTSADSTPRNLAGLKNVKCKVYYMDDVKYKGGK